MYISTGYNLYKMTMFNILTQADESFTKKTLDLAVDSANLPLIV